MAIPPWESKQKPHPLASRKPIESRAASLANTLQARPRKALEGRSDMLQSSRTRWVREASRARGAPQMAARESWVHPAARSATLDVPCRAKGTFPKSGVRCSLDKGHLKWCSGQHCGSNFPGRPFAAPLSHGRLRGPNFSRLGPTKRSVRHFYQTWRRSGHGRGQEEPR
jgi:hypothetical protein